MDQEEKILRLQSLFRGNSRIIGQASNDLIPDGPDGKVTQSKRGFAPGPATTEHWQNHLNGIKSLGLVPITDYQEVKFMALDVDLSVMEELKVTLTSLCAQVEANGMPFIVCRSKSGAAHLYVFFKDSVAVAEPRKVLQNMAAYMGMVSIPKPVEYFPHTSKLDKDSNGKYINLPYFGGDDTDRYGLDATGNRLSLDEFIYLAESKMVSKADFCKWKAPASVDLSLRDVVVNGPPCLQTIYDQGLPDGTKNELLFQFGILFKKHSRANFEDLVEQVNLTRCETPHDHSDLSNTMKSLRKKDYHYNCSHACMAPICAKNLCMTRKYGIKSAVEFPAIKEIVQWGANDEYFELVLEKSELLPEEIKVKILSADFLSFERVQAAMVQAIHVVLPIPKKFDWLEFVQGCMAKVKRMDVPKEFSTEAAIKSLILQYASSRTLGTKLEDLLVKKPVKQGECVLIRHQDLQEEILKRRYPGYVEGLEYAVVQGDLMGQITVVTIGERRFPVFSIPDPKINQQEILEKVATDYQPKY